MDIKALQWDTQHFNKRIGRFSTPHLSLKDYNNILNLKNQFDVVYIFSNSFESTLPKPINTKVFFLGHHEDLKSYSDEYITLLSNDDFDRIFDLSIVAGEFSRFKIDPKFEYQDFHSLYIKWVENSFSKDHIVLGYKKDNIILGMITLKFDPLNNIANIELIGVDPKAQGMKIGSKLIWACMKYVKENSQIKFLSVQTQKENSLACSFYLKCGFKTHNSVNIHHAWPE